MPMKIQTLRRVSTDLIDLAERTDGNVTITLNNTQGHQLVVSPAALADLGAAIAQFDVMPEDVLKDPV